MDKIGREWFEKTVQHTPVKLIQKGNIISSPDGNRVYVLWDITSKKVVLSTRDGKASWSHKAKKVDIPKIFDDFKKLGWDIAYKKWKFSS